jgi:outer membrane receptor protein involved in Fe transport
MANNPIFSLRPERKLLYAAILTITTSSPMFAQAAMLEEVVVTAQKRVQSLQDVPISVSVTSGETLDDYAIGDLGELSASIPNVTIGQNAGGGPFSRTVRVGRSALRAKAR